MLAPAVLMLVAAASEPSPRLVSVGFRAIEVDAKKAEFFGNYFAQKLSEATGLKVSTTEEMSAVLGLERQRALLGCADEVGSCMAEMAAGMGAEGVVMGSVARVGGGWALSVKVISSKDSSSVAARVGQVSDESGVLAWLAESALQLGRDVRARLAPNAGPMPVVASSSSSRFVQSKAWVPTALGGALVVVGVVLNVLSLSAASTINGGASSIRTAQELRDAVDAGRNLNYAGITLLASGAASLAIAAVLLVFNRPDDSLALRFGVGPGSFAIGGRF